MEALLPLLPETAPATPVASPSGWLNLPALHAKLLPLAEAAGHEQLGLSCECIGAHLSDYTYTAYGSGGATGFREYIGRSTAGGGYSYHDFERVLTAKLQEQARFRATSHV